MGVVPDYQSRSPEFESLQRFNVEVHISEPRTTQPTEMSTWAEY